MTNLSSIKVIKEIIIAVCMTIYAMYALSLGYDGVLVVGFLTALGAMVGIVWSSKKVEEKASS